MMKPVKSKGRGYSYILFHKPYGVLTQFTDEGGRKTLSDFGPFPRDVYPVGRLDADSEGLLLLTDDPRAKHRLLDPRYGHRRTYLAQVERIPDTNALSNLTNGIKIEGVMSRKAEVRLFENPPLLAPRSVPIRFRKNIPTSWLAITLTEGRNRQVRRMTAAVGHPTLRLVRIEFGPLRLGSLKPGEQRRLKKTERENLLKSLGEFAPPESS